MDHSITLVAKFATASNFRCSDAVAGGCGEFTSTAPRNQQEHFPPLMEAEARYKARGRKHCFVRRTEGYKSLLFLQSGNLCRFKAANFLGEGQ